MDNAISTVSPDEIQFAYQTWLEYPDRIIRFPACNQFWNITVRHQQSNVNGFINDKLMILVGPAMYHRYYNYLYLHKMPQVVKDWLNTDSDCEDIAMNFLIANYTSKPPIKVQNNLILYSYENMQVLSIRF